MRKDMGRCVIEAARRGSSARGYKIREYGKFVSDADGIEYEGLMRIPSRMTDDKSFSDVLGPLNGFLRASCGRMWDEVYSELSILRKTKSRGLSHILDDHIPVAKNTYRAINGHVYDRNNHGVSKVGGYFNDFYVEPETGILREAAKYRKWRSMYRRAVEAAKPIEAIKVSETAEYRKIAGIWYYQEFIEHEAWAWHRAGIRKR